MERSGLRINELVNAGRIDYGALLDALDSAQREMCEMFGEPNKYDIKNRVMAYPKKEEMFEAMSRIEQELKAANH
jgi:hypothetical protein